MNSVQWQTSNKRVNSILPYIIGLSGTLIRFFLEKDIKSTAMSKNKNKHLKKNVFQNFCAEI